MIDDQRPHNEPDTPTPPTEHPTKIKSLATTQLNRTPEWTLIERVQNLPDSLLIVWIMR
jgi:hypothetical protein